MQVCVTYLAEKNEIMLQGRFDPPAQADFKVKLRPGEKAFGLDFEQIKDLSLIETDPDNEHFAKTTVVRLPPSPLPDLPHPAWLRKP